VWTRTPLPAVTDAPGTPSPNNNAELAQSNLKPASANQAFDPLLIVILALVGGGAALTVVGILIQRRS